ncbi:MAG TPA: ABC transporter permease [Thermoanaerobaculia bacterium]|jgi:predicted permease|nr:ABC transporter permease [Thermoanaerobaculia bacterium]
MLGQLFSVLRTLRHRPQFEDAMAEEMRFHIEQYTADLVSSGVPPAEAERRARLEFGSVDNVKTDCREASGLRLFDELHQDLRYAVRLMRKTPGFTATALATLALCIGANLTIFAVVDSVLLRPLPFPAADRLMSVYNTYPKAGVPNDGCSLPNYYERRGHIAAFSGLAVYRDAMAVVGETGATEQMPVSRVSPDFFPTLGLGLVMGRAFTEAETASGKNDAAILTDSYWRQRLGADPRVLGRGIRVNGISRTVVGVLPPRFSFLSSEARIYLPLASSPDERAPRQRHSGTAHMIARLKPGVALAEAQAQIDAHNAAVNGDDPESRRMAEAGFRSLVVPLRADHVAAIRPILLLTQAGALFLLLIGAVNLVNLLLIRASGRIKELAVRQALGAGQRHVVSGVLVETTLLTLIGGLLGLAVGAGGIRLLGVLGTDRLPLGAHIAFDARLAAVALAGAVVLGLILGAPIAWYNLRNHSAGGTLFESRGGTAGRATQRLRHGFIVAQIALAFVLLAGAGLLGLSLRKVMTVSPGFRPGNVLSGQLVLPVRSYPDRQDFVGAIERLTAEVGRQPGVQAVGFATNVPLSGISNKSAATVEGYKPPPGDSPHGHYSYSVGGDYFTAMGFSLREGRFLTAADSRRAQRVCVVDEDFARRYWPSGGAIGHRLFQGGEAGNDADAFTIVGVVGPVKQAGLVEDDAQGAVYYPLGHRIDHNLWVVVRTSLPPESLGPALRRAVRTVDPELPVNDLRSMETRVADSLVSRRSPALLAGLFAGIALLLTAIGTYGVLSYAVAQRRREIGLRMALGARPEQVRWQFVGLALRLLAAGTVLGVLGAWLTGKAMQSVLFQVPALHVATLVGTAAILGTVSLIACLLPSDRAARISPMEAMIEE